MRSVIRPQSPRWEPEHVAALDAVVARYSAAAAAGDAAMASDGTAVSSGSSSNKRIRSQITDSCSSTGTVGVAAAAAAASGAVAVAQGNAGNGDSTNNSMQMETDLFSSNNPAADAFENADTSLLSDTDDIDADLDSDHLFEGLADEEEQSL
jgi:hypothetical protein